MKKGVIAITWIFHPILLYFYLIVLISLIQPVEFLSANLDVILFLIPSFFTIVMFPLIASLLMKKLGLLNSIEMNERESRIGPLIATAIFFIWYYINVRDNPDVPVIISTIALAASVAICLGFFINNFTKLSLHMIGSGLFLASIVLLAFQVDMTGFYINLDLNNYLEVSPVLLVFGATLLSGIIGFSRLYLNAHSSSQISLGFLVGVFSVLVAYRINDL